jgi:hypothetical protein
MERGNSNGIRERRIDRLGVFFWHDCSVNNNAESGRRKRIAAND